VEDVQHRALPSSTDGHSAHGELDGYRNLSDGGREYPPGQTSDDVPAFEKRLLDTAATACVRASLDD